MGSAWTPPSLAAGLALQAREVRRWLTRRAGPPVVEDAERQVREVVTAASWLHGSHALLAEARLADAHEAGLALREGEQLTPAELATFAKLEHFATVLRLGAVGGALRVLGRRPVALRVCRGLGCGIVYRAPSARSRVCPRCRRSPAPTPKFNDAHGPGRWFIQLRTPWRGTAREGRRIGYEGVCRACQRGFTSLDPRQRYCLACGDGAGRARRNRGGGEPQRVWRWRHVDGHAHFVISFHRGYGHTARLEAVDGVIETTDAELIRHLNDNSELRRVS